MSEELTASSACACPGEKPRRTTTTTPGTSTPVRVAHPQVPELSRIRGAGLATHTSVSATRTCPSPAREKCPRAPSLATAATLIVVLAACGGGGTATVTKTDEPEAPNATSWRDNPSAEDLRDHWNDSGPFAARLGLEPVVAKEIDERKQAIQTLLAPAERSPGETGTRLRNVTLDAINILGERNGITYGQWKGGSAGTFHIEFDFRNAPEISPHWRAALERAGKLWSHRIAADTDGFEGEIGDYAVDTDGLLIAVYTKSGHTSTGSPVAYYRKGEDLTDFEPYFGEIRIGRDRGHTEEGDHNVEERIILGPWHECRLESSHA